ncbi:restriction endonuclease subunit S [Clostridium perfringens]|uniref:restriction endonuclease subunit S n=1 Tax=Clostridium perfringens TaxID=1502 RepID=UPI000D71CDC5|nr:restriction endonuclease subunit S [Clostridium perfringens]PWX67231.1 restriction endonuclease subunit S [Clostridium perfringens]
MSRNVPKLRFKGFEDEWKEYRLGDLVNYKKGFAFKSDYYVNEGIRIIKISDTTEDSISEIGSTFINSSHFEKFIEWKLSKDDIIVSTVGSRPPLYSSMVGKIVKVPYICDGTLLNQNLVKLIPNNIVNDFLYNILKRPNYTNYIENICRGNANQVSITLDDLFEFKIIFPLLQEQEKIANFLSKVDSIIEKQEKKVQYWNSYKRGMMQQIFSQKIRFKDENGRDYPEWEEKKAGDLFINISNKDHNGDIDVLSVTQDRGVLLRKDLEIDIKFDNESLKNYKKVMPGDFIISLRSFQGGFEISNQQGLISPAYTVFNFNEKDKFNSKYFAHLFKTKTFIRKLSGFIYGIRDGKAISFTDFKTMKLLYPCLEEENKIVNILSKVDNIIEKENQKLEELKQWKKGLLQQMFV